MRNVDKPKLPAGVYRKNAKGKTYYYFNMGKNSEGKTMLRRLPDLRSIEFGPALNAAVLSQKRITVKGRVMLSVRDMAAQYEKSPEFARKAVNTQKSYLIYLGVFVKQFGHAPAEQIAQRHILDLMNSFGPRLGAANLTLSVVGAVYTWARRKGLLANSPTDDIEPNELGEHEPWPVDLLERALTCDVALVRESVALMYFTAQRIGDVCALRWSDVRGDRLHLRQQKTGHDLDFPLHSRLREIIGTPGQLGPILTVNGRPLTTAGLRKRIKAWTTAQGYDVTPHGLRKNAVNALLEVGCTVAETAAISGQSLQIVEKYARRRNRSSLGSAAILKWDQNAKRTCKPVKTGTDDAEK